jgi:hypothetical protein
VKLYFAGGDAWLDLLLDMGVKYQLMSYYYFRSVLKRESSKALAMLTRMKMAKAKGYSFFLDSGAFTYQTKQQAGGGAGLPDPSVYFREYYDFVNSHADLFDIIAEFDVDNVAKDRAGNLITTDQANRWINELLDLPHVAKKVLPTIHAHRGDSWTNDWLVDLRSPLVALSSAQSAKSTGYAAGVISKAHRFGKFIHGFGQTRIKTDLKFTKFDSVDSTTWLRADKYGGTCIFQDGKFIVLDHLHKGDRRRFRNYFESWGLDFAKVMKDDLETMRLATIIAWRELAGSFEQKWMFQTKGKYPYLYQAALEGREFSEHPLLTKKRLELQGKR